MASFAIREKDGRLATGFCAEQSREWEARSRTCGILSKKTTRDQEYTRNTQSSRGHLKPMDSLCPVHLGVHRANHREPPHNHRLQPEDRSSDPNLLISRIGLQRCEAQVTKTRNHGHDLNHTLRSRPPAMAHSARLGHEICPLWLQGQKFHQKCQSHLLPHFRDHRVQPIAPQQLERLQCIQSPRDQPAIPIKQIMNEERPITINQILFRHLSNALVGMTAPTVQEHQMEYILPLSRRAAQARYLTSV
jgi:hypothetical protein